MKPSGYVGQYKRLISGKYGQMHILPADIVMVILTIADRVVMHLPTSQNIALVNYQSSKIFKKTL